MRFGVTLERNGILHTALVLVLVVPVPKDAFLQVQDAIPIPYITVTVKHNCRMLKCWPAPSCGACVFQGSMDMGIFPLDKPADITQLQIGFELQHTEKHKLLYEQNRARVVRAKGVGVPPVAAPAQPAAAGGP